MRGVWMELEGRARTFSEHAFEDAEHDGLEHDALQLMTRARKPRELAKRESASPQLSVEDACERRSVRVRERPRPRDGTISKDVRPCLWREPLLFWVFISVLVPAREGLYCTLHLSHSDSLD